MAHQHTSPQHTSPSSSPTLLTLPRGVRSIIYRYLLEELDEITFSSQVNLHPAILRTCKQIYSEALPILNEITWGIMITSQNGIQHAPFMGVDLVKGSSGYEHGFRIDRVRRLAIIVHVPHFTELENVRSAVRKVCRVLAHIPPLDDVRLDLCHGYIPHGISNPGWSISFPGDSLVLKNFGLLRYVSHVTMDGVEPRFANRLTHQMTQSLPLGTLFRMYDALEANVGPLNTCVDILQEASEAVLNHQVQKFIRLRASIIDQIAGSREGLESRLLQNDGPMEPWERWLDSIGLEEHWVDKWQSEREDGEDDEEGDEEGEEEGDEETDFLHEMGFENEADLWAALGAEGEADMRSLMGGLSELRTTYGDTSSRTQYDLQ
ncbi:hypothetical protein EDB81DRAFT_771513 [Dactylonectria macrodidyma]|uniref:F-box domain-containing protein n=1 Tax=Dactylonectria macrodidyma TaxID=307937 RepID=A0A9P9FTI9_9HYPO|nr:hypothetical protein EDB81DRAFT_771513 [Dactylonectria macrodidyma]